MPGQKPTRFPDAPLSPPCQEYLADLGFKRVSSLTIRDYRSTLRRLCIFHNARHLTDFDGPDGTRLLQSFITQTWPNASAATIKKQIAALRDFFGWCVDYDMLGRDPTRRLEIPRGVARRRKPIPKENVERLIESQPETCDRLALLLAVELGLRAQSVRAIQLADFDLSARRIRIAPIKRSPERYVPIIPGSDIPLLVEELYADGWKPDWFLLHVHRKNNLPGHEDRRIIRLVTRPLSRSAFHSWRLMRFAVATAASPDREPLPIHDFHSLRTTAGTTIYKSSGVKAAQMLLGHKSAQTTLDQYVWLEDHELIEAMVKAKEAWDEA